MNDLRTILANPIVTLILIIAIGAIIGWIYEEKYDGIRILAYKEGAHISLITRNNIVRTERYPEVAAAVSKLKPRTLLLDGEVVVFGKHNISHFQLLQQGKGPVKYAAFDCLYLNGKDLRSAPGRRNPGLPRSERASGRGRVGSEDPARDPRLRLIHSDCFAAHPGATGRLLSPRVEARHRTNTSHGRAEALPGAGRR